MKIKSLFKIPYPTPDAITNKIQEELRENEEFIEKTGGFIHQTRQWMVLTDIEKARKEYDFVAEQFQKESAEYFKFTDDFINTKILKYVPMIKIGKVYISKENLFGIIKEIHGKIPNKLIKELYFKVVKEKYPFTVVVPYSNSYINVIVAPMVVE